MSEMMLLIQDDATLLAVAGVISSAYVICLIVGGGLLLISTVFGGDSDADIEADFDGGLDADFDADFEADLETDFEADVEVDAHVDAAHGHIGDGALSLSSWFSVRFLVYFAAMFGLVGTVLTRMSDTPSHLVLVYAIAGGVVVGQVAHQLMRYLKRTSVDGSLHTQDYVDTLARVTVAIHPPKRGEVAIQIGDGERFVAADAKHKHDAFEPGQTVGVVGLHGGVAVVVSLKEYEFLSDS